MSAEPKPADAVDDPRCPSCGRVSSTLAKCEHCGVALGPGTDRSFGTLRDVLGVGRYAALGGLIDGLATVPLLWALTRSVGLQSQFLQIVAVGIVVGAALGAALGRVFVRRRRARALKRAVEHEPLQSIANAREGRVKIAGRLRALRTIQSWNGATCVAFERHVVAEDGSVRVQGLSGSFEVDDGSGVLARVDPSDILVIDGVGRADEAFVPDGAHVEIVGRATRAVASAHSPAGRPNRSAQQVLEFIGTKEEPLLLRMTRAPQGDTHVATTGVRVEPDRVSATVSNENAPTVDEPQATHREAARTSRSPDR